MSEDNEFSEIIRIKHFTRTLQSSVDLGGLVESLQDKALLLMISDATGEEMEKAIEEMRLLLREVEITTELLSKYLEDKE